MEHSPSSETNSFPASQEIHHNIGYDMIYDMIRVYDMWGENNGKLPPRTCPGCSVPEPYQSHDWALVSASPASKAEY